MSCDAPARSAEMQQATEEIATADFYEDLAHALERQYERFAPYRTLCEIEDVTPADIRAMIADRDLAGIPPVPADWFKRHTSKGLFRELSHLEATGCWLLSSSTSGDHSYTWRTADDMRAIAASFSRGWHATPVARSLFFSPDRRYLERSWQRLSVDGRCTRPFATVPMGEAERVYGDLEYLVELNPVETERRGEAVLDLRRERLAAALERAEREGSAIGLSFSVLLLYPALKALPRSYAFGSNAYLVSGAGGWDGKKGSAVGEPIHKPTYVRELAERLGMPEQAWETNFLDIYGSTETGKAQIGWYSREVGDFLYEVGDDVRLYVIDPATGRPAGAGGRGYPRFLSSDGVEGCAGACVQQKDLVTVVSAGDDGAVTCFTHVARASGADGQGGVGCALEMAKGVRV